MEKPDNGYINLWRKILDNPLWCQERFTIGQMWVDLLLQVMYKEEEIIFNKQLLRCGRAQLITSVNSLAKRWKCTRARVEKTLAKYKQMNMIIYNKVYKRFIIITICNFDSYQKFKPEKTQQSIQQSEQQSEQVPLFNCISIKKNIKEKKEKYVLDSEEMILAIWMVSVIKHKDPNFEKTPNALQTWAREIDLMIRKDNRPIDEIRSIFEWCQEDSFEYKNVLCPGKLRKRYTQLKLKYESDSKTLKKKWLETRSKNQVIR